ncbi:MAG: FAD-dependent oxidoreductase [Vicinamibacteria bacterium]
MTATAATLTSDVLVIGGGTAGAATALALRRRGLSVIVVERGREPRERAGESLSPAARRALESLGVWDAFLADGHAAAAGMRSLWGRSEAREAHFIRHADGPGWHLDRRRFDARLLSEAAAAGTRVIPGETPEAVSYDGRAWHVRTSSGRRLDARAAVDAGGRAAPLARRAGARRVVLDRLVAIAAFLPADAGAAFDRFTLVEAVESGWWYSAPLPDGRRVVSFFTDADLAPRMGGPSAFRRLLGRAPATAARCGGAARVRRLPLETAPCVVSAGTSRLTAVAGPAWLAVGDAAAAFDPLSSQGLETALSSALRAAEAVARHLAGDAGALPGYPSHVREIWRRYLYERARVYEQETRWPDAPFWKRRQVHLAAAGAA